MTEPQYGGDPNYNPYQQPTSPAPYPPAPAAPYQQSYPPAVAPGYAVPMVAVAAPPSSGIAVASMVLGIIGAVFGWFTLGIPCILAIIFGHIGITQTKNNVRSGRGMAITGLVLGYLFVAFTLWVTIELFFIAHSACVAVGATTC